MKRMILLVLVFVLVSNVSVFAGVLPGGIQAVLEMKYEDDQLDADQSLGTAKLTLKKSMQLGSLNVTPYVFIEDESYEGFLSAASRKETESAVGLDVLAFQNDRVKLTVGTLYEYENNVGTDDDGLLTLKMKAEF